MIPVSKLIGISGTITAGGMIIPVIALLLEPEYGVLSVITGTMIASLSPLNPLKFAGLDFVPGVMYLLVASLAVRGRSIQAGLVLFGLIGLFVLTPNTRVFVGTSLASPPIPFFWLHLVALGVLLSPVTRNIVGWIQSGNSLRVGVSIGIAGFAGTMSEHISGGILYALFFGPGAVRAWPAIYVVYPIERAIIVAGAILICTPFILNSRTIRESILGKVQLARDRGPFSR